MKYLLDTCIISELIKSKPNISVVQWLNSIDEQNIYLSVLTIGEIQKGIEKLPASKRKEKLQIWLNTDLQQRFNGRIIDINNEIALCWGKIQGKAEQTGKKMSVIDSLIASTSIIFNCTVVTRNTKDIENSGCDFINPWV